MGARGRSSRAGRKGDAHTQISRVGIEQSEQLVLESIVVFPLVDWMRISLFNCYAYPCLLANAIAVLLPETMITIQTEDQPERIALAQRRARMSP